MKRRRVQRTILCLSVLGLLLVGGGALILQARHRQYDLDRQLIASLVKKDIRQAAALVNAGADPNTPFRPPQPPSFQQLWRHLFHIRSRSNPRDIATAYLQSDNPTAFFIACGAPPNRFGYTDWEGKEAPELVKAMLLHGAKLNSKNALDEMTPLMWAVMNGHRETTRILLEHGADVKARRRGGATPLMVQYDSSPEIIRLLVDHGADVNARDDAGNTPLIALLPSRNPATIRILLTHGVDVNAYNHQGSTPLIEGAASHPDVVRLLIASGADVNARDHDGQTPLLIATSAATAPLSTIRLLVSLGADVNAKDKDGNTPLSYATGTTTPAIVRFLLAHGADIDARNSSGSTPLLTATNDTAILLPLLDHGAKIDARDKDGDTVLTLAISDSEVPIAVVRLLLQRGADPNLHARGEPTALQTAQTNKRPDIVALLRQAGAKK